MSEYVTRAEHDAKLSATEERMNAKFTEIMSEIRIMRSEMDVRLSTMSETLRDYRDDARYSKWALWAIAAAMVASALAAWLK